MDSQRIKRQRDESEAAYDLSYRGDELGKENRFPCVKLRGLPYDVQESDVKAFLGLDPLDILLVKRDGRFSGEAFVLLGCSSFFEAALQKHKMYLGSRYVEVTPMKKYDYYKAIVQDMTGGSSFRPSARPSYMDQGMMGMGMGMGMDPSMGMGMGMAYPDQQGMMGMGSGMGSGYGMGAGSAPRFRESGTNWVKMRGLPYYSQVEDIIAWFDDPNLGIPRLTPANVTILDNEMGRPSGMALVQFATPDEASRALQKNRAAMGTRYIELFPASRTDIDRYQPHPPEPTVHY